MVNDRDYLFSLLDILKRIFIDLKQNNQYVDLNLLKVTVKL